MAHWSHISPIYLIFGFFDAIWLVLRVDLAFFAEDYLATLVGPRYHSFLRLIRAVTVGNLTARLTI